MIAKEVEFDQAVLCAHREIHAEPTSMHNQLT